MRTKISSALGAIADKLDKKGLIREALKIDKVAAIYDDIVNRPHGPGWTPKHDSKKVFTIHELELKKFKDEKEYKPSVVLDDQGNKLSRIQALPSYGGWGNNSPAKFLVIDGKKALIVDMGEVRGGRHVDNLKLVWDI
jgi:hypothetical protein